MARGINNVSISGNVGSAPVSGATQLGEPAGSFMLASERRTGNVVWVRVNVYGSLARICQERVRKGTYVVVTGELMNRISSQSQNDLVEIRCDDLVIIEERTNQHVGKGK